MRAVFGMATVSMNKLLVLLDFASLNVFKDINVAFVSGYKEVAVVNENKDVQNLLTIVHNVSE